jgi:hypothetical protein
MNANANEESILCRRIFECLHINSFRNYLRNCYSIEFGSMNLNCKLTAMRNGKEIIKYVTVIGSQDDVEHNGSSLPSWITINSSSLDLYWILQISLLFWNIFFCFVDLMNIRKGDLDHEFNESYVNHLESFLPLLCENCPKMWKRLARKFLLLVNNRQQRELIAFTQCYST